MTTTSKTRILVEGAMLIALATILSYIKFYDLPFGGSITLEMLPLVIMGLRNGPKWGCFTGFVHGLLQMIIGFSNVMYCATLLSQIGCILLDYLLAFTVLGLAPVFATVCGKHVKIGYVVGAIICGILRFVCSVTYNGSYMVPDIIILAVIIAILAAAAPKLFKSETK